MIGLKGTLNVCIVLADPGAHSLTQRTFLQVIDNSGALLVECVNVLKQKVNNGWGGVGDEIVCIVKRARPLSGAALTSSTAVKVRRGDVRRAVIVRTKKSVRRPDGRLVKFDDNAAVLLNNKREMLGTRIAGVVSADLRMKGWGKIVSLAPKVRELSASLWAETDLRRHCRLYRFHILDLFVAITREKVSYHVMRPILLDLVSSISQPIRDLPSHNLHRGKSQIGVRSP